LSGLSSLAKTYYNQHAYQISSLYLV